MDTGNDTRVSPLQSNKKAIIELGIFIPVVTVIAFASIFYFELGYFDYFRIPADYIEVEVSKSAYTIFILFTFVCLLLWLRTLVVALFKHTKTLIKRKDWKSPHWDTVKGLFITLLVTASIIYLFREAFEINNNNALSLLYLLLSLVTGIVLRTTKPGAKGLLSNIDFSVVHFVGVVLMVCSLACLLMFFSGRFFAKTSSRPTLSNKEERNLILLRRYSGYAIYGIRDSTHKNDNAKKWFQTFIISRGKNDADTISGSGLTPYDKLH